MSGLIKAYPNSNSGPEDAKVITETDLGNKRGLDVNDLSLPFSLRVVRGDVPKFSSQRAIGKVEDVSIGVRSTIWGGDIAAFSFPPSAAVISIVSDNVNDTLLGTGARTIMVEGLDSSGDFITENINLLGLTPVTTIATFTRLNKSTVIAAGTQGSNEGTITLTIGATRVGRIKPEENTMLTLMI